MLDTQDLKKIRLIFLEGIEQLVLPRFDEIDIRFEQIEKKLDTHEQILKEHTEILEEHTQTLDKIDRTLQSEIHWRDHADKRIMKLEKKVF